MNKEKYIKIVIFFIILFCAILFKDKVGDVSFAFKEDGVQVLDNSNLEIYFFDVGQADSILIKNNNDTMLIDAGNNSDGDNLVNYLKNDIGISDIDIVVGTHPHEEHIGGLDDVISSFDIGKIYMPDAISNSKTFEDVLDVIEKKDYSVSVPIIDEIFELGNLKFKVIYTGSDERDLNNTSIVIKMIFGNTSYLFMGDATSKTEKKILDSDINVDVIKIGHHGSSYSSSEDFLNKVIPKYAIIQVGVDNNYNHPHKETLDNLISRNIKIYRTDLDGTIKLISDGDKIEFKKLETKIDG